MDFFIRDKAVAFEWDISADLPAVWADLQKLPRQVDGSSTQRYNGMGVGLSLSRQLARLMRGELIVESQRGAGATFILTLNLPPDGAPLSVIPACDHFASSAA